MASRVMSKEACLKVKEMYDERTPGGRRVHTHASIGKHFGVSETTIYRILYNLGAFMDLPEPIPDKELEEMVQKSWANVQRLLAEPDKPKGGPVKPKNQPEGDPPEGMNAWDPIGKKWFFNPYISATKS